MTASPDVVVLLRHAFSSHQSGELAVAERLYRQVVELDANQAQALHYLGLIVHQRNEGEAIDLLRRAVIVNPGDAPCWNNLGNMLQEGGRLQEAIVAYREAVRLVQDHVNALYNLAVSLLDAGDAAGSVASFRQALQHEPRDGEMWNAIGEAFTLNQQFDEGRRCFETALAMKPDHVKAHNNLGYNLLMSGEMEPARSCFEKALEFEPDNASALEYLSSMQGFGENDEDLLIRISALANRESVPIPQRVSYRFALGKMYEDRGNWDSAFEHYDAGNRLHRKNIPYDRAVHQSRIDRLIAVFDEELISGGLDGASDSDVPVFIVGMPRSGTSLVEQILASHSQVHGAGELGYFERLRQPPTDQTRSFEDYIGTLDCVMVAAITRDYLELLLANGSSALRVTDKMPGNYLYLGLIAMIFPNAKIIYCQRNPLDTCVSIYFHNFKLARYGWDLHDIGHQYAQHLRLMAHWMKVLPGRLFTIEYEDLVNEQEARSRELITHCALDWDDRCLRYYDNDRPVWTPSHSQVRQPIYTSSIGRWKRYAAHLDDLREALSAGSKHLSRIEDLKRGQDS